LTLAGWFFLFCLTSPYGVVTIPLTGQIKLFTGVVDAVVLVGAIALGFCTCGELSRTSIGLKQSRVVVCQPKIDGLGQAGEAGEAGGEEIFLGAVNPAKLIWQTSSGTLAKLMSDLLKACHSKALAFFGDVYYIKSTTATIIAFAVNIHEKFWLHLMKKV
jgi:hypothetical protein